MAMKNIKVPWAERLKTVWKDTLKQIIKRKNIMKVLMITHFTNTSDESGNNRFKYLAEVLSSFGKVRVITTTFSHNEKHAEKNLTKWNEY